MLYYCSKGYWMLGPTLGYVGNYKVARLKIIKKLLVTRPTTEGKFDYTTDSKGKIKYLYSIIKDILTIQDNLVIRWGEVYGSEKLNIALKSASKHFTITNVGHRKAINLHLTRQNRKGRPNYLIELSYFMLGRILIEFNRELKKYFTKKQPVKLLTLSENSDKYYYLEVENIDNDNSEIVIFNQKEKKIATRSNIPIDTIEKSFLTQNEILESKSNSFIIYKIIAEDLVTMGYITKYQVHEGKQYYSFLSINELEKFKNYLTDCILKILFKHNFRYKETLKRILKFK